MATKRAKHRARPKAAAKRTLRTKSGASTPRVARRPHEAPRHGAPRADRSDRTDDAPRVRRTAEAAQDAILDAAEARLARVGPNALRLTDIAKDVGISHPAVLHHFGSRENLLAALVARTVDRVQADLLRTLEGADEHEVTAAAVLERALTGLTSGGHARVVAWLCLAGHDVPLARQPLVELARGVHARRVATLENGAAEPSFEDSLFLVLLCTLTLFGQALFGDIVTTRDGVTTGGDDLWPRFREWFAKLLVDRA